MHFLNWRTGERKTFPTPLYGGFSLDSAAFLGAPTRYCAPYQALKVTRWQLQDAGHLLYTDSTGRFFVGRCGSARPAHPKPISGPHPYGDNSLLGGWTTWFDRKTPCKRARLRSYDALSGREVDWGVMDRCGRQVLHTSYALVVERERGHTADIDGYPLTKYSVRVARRVR
jgi:hypothetical protein